MRAQLRRKRRGLVQQFCRFTVGLGRLGNVTPSNLLAYLAKEGQLHVNFGLVVAVEGVTEFV